LIRPAFVVGSTMTDLVSIVPDDAEERKFQPSRRLARPHIEDVRRQSSGYFFVHDDALMAE
jgi:hypothetical protein